MQLQEIMVPSETISHRCKESEKALFGIENFLNLLQARSRGIIKSFDLSHPDVIEVVYSKIDKLPFTWEDIKNQVENELVHYVRFYPKA
jgi:hypothetical protein